MAMPVVPLAVYNTGDTSGMNSGTTYSSATMTSGMMSTMPSAGVRVGGNANLPVAMIVGISLLILLGSHLLGFRWGFDVSVGRRS
jgi:hypothetical protein